MEIKHIQFDPAHYNTTYQVVKKLHSGMVHPQADGEVIVDYIFEWELIGLFYAIGLYTPKPEDAPTPEWPQQLRLQHRNAVAMLILRLFQVIALIFLASKFIWELFHIPPR